MVAGQGIVRHFRQGHADAALEPKAAFIHERDDDDGRVADVGRQLGEVVEGGFGQRVEHVITAQRGETRGLIYGRRDGGGGGASQMVGDLM